MRFKFNKQKGQVSRLLLVLAIVVLVAVVIVYLVMQMAERPPAPTVEDPGNGGVPQPSYEKTLGNIKFVFIDSQDFGSVLTPAMAEKQSSARDSLETTERFVVVTIGAQNKGKQNIEERAWEMGDIIDSEGRRFVPLKGYNINNWIPETSDCGALLKPEFDPVPCTKIYEVAKISTGLKITVMTGKDNQKSNFTSDDFEQELIDLIVR